MTQIQSSAITDQTAVPTQIIPATLDDSIITVLNTLSGKTYQTADLKNVSLTEDVLYAGLVFDALRNSAPSTATAFKSELKDRFDKRTKRNDRQPLSKAVQDILDNSVKSKTLSSQAMNKIVSQSLGMAQLDKNHSALSRVVKTGGMEQFKKTIGVNKFSSDAVTKKFERTIHELNFVTPTVARRQRANLDKVFASLKQTKTPSEDPQTPKEESKPSEPTSADPLETDKPAELPDLMKETSSPNDLVYNPKSKKDGHALLMIPVKYAKEVTGVDITVDGKVIETLKHTGLGNDGRRYFRSSKDGKGLPDNVTFNLRFTNNTDLEIAIKDTGESMIRSYGE